MKIVAWIAVVMTSLFVFGFFLDWTDVQKNKDLGYIEFRVNTQQIGRDLATAWNNTTEFLTPTPLQNNKK